MASFTSQWRVIAATLFSTVAIVGAFVAAKGFFIAPVVQASTESDLLQSIAARDSDNDGLPDWEESLYGTDPQKADTRGLGTTDGEAVAKGLIVPKATADITPPPTSDTATVSADPHDPKAAAEGTLTDAFAKDFLTLYLAAKAKAGGSLTKDEVTELVDKSLTQLAAGISPAPDFKTINDLAKGSSGPEALHAYAVAAENVFAAHGSQLPKSELQYLGDAVQKNDDSAIDHIRELSAAYRNSAIGLAALPVPPELAPTMVNLINAMARIGDISNDFARVKTDPLMTMLVLKQYGPAVTTLASSFDQITRIYTAAGVVLKAGTPGSQFEYITSKIRADEQKKP